MPLPRAYSSKCSSMFRPAGRGVRRRLVELLDRPVETVTIDLADTEALELIGLHPGTEAQQTQLPEDLPRVDLLPVINSVACLRREQQQRLKRPPRLRDGDRVRVLCRRPFVLRLVS